MVSYIECRTHQLRVHCAAIGHPILSDTIYGYEGEGSSHGGLSSSEFVDGADIQLQQSIHTLIDHHDTNLCLHAKELHIFHPFTGAPMIFKCPPPF